MKTQFRLGLAIVIALVTLVGEVHADKGKLGKFGIGGFGGFHRIKASGSVNQINVGGRFLLVPADKIGIFADFGYYLKKNSQTVMQPKIGFNFIIPTGGMFIPYLGGHGSYNIIKTTGFATIKKFGFGGQLGAHIMFGAKFSMFLEGHFEYWLTTVKSKVFGGLGGLMVHF